MSTMYLNDAITAYLSDRRAKGYATSTVRGEAICLRALMADVGNISLRAFRHQHLDAFWAAHPDWSSGTFNLRRACLKSFFKWCRNRGYMPRDLDLMEEVRAQRPDKRPRVLIPQHEFATVIETREDPRQRITFAIGLYLFTRMGEISDLRWQDYDSDAATIQVYREKTKTLDVLPVCTELAAELRRWRMTYGSETGTPPLPGWRLVPAYTRPQGHSVKGTKGFQFWEERQILPTEKSSLAKVIRSGLIDLGYYQPHEGGHTLRRSGATALYNQLTSVGHDRAIRLCQAMLGHASIKTTEIYLRLDLDRKVRNDLLAGRPMFPAGSGEGTVIRLGGAASGTTDG